MVAFTPAGRMEAFFRELSAAGPVSPEEFARVSKVYGMTVIGPPLTPRSA